MVGPAGWPGECEMSASTGDGAQFKDVFAPDVPERAKVLLRADEDDQSLSRIYWTAGSCAVLVVLAIGLLRRGEDAVASAGWMLLAAVPMVLLAVGARAATARRRDRWLTERHRQSHFPAALLADAADRFPEIGQRLSRLRTVLAELAASTAHRDGWLPGVDPDALAAIEWAVTRRLMDTVPVREVVDAAAGRGRLADQAAARAADLASVDAEVDAQLDQLAETAVVAGRIDELLGDLRLAEKLTAEGPTEGETRLRRALPPAAATDAQHFAAGAGAVEDLLRAQLGAFPMPVKREPVALPEAIARPEPVALPEAVARPDPAASPGSATRPARASQPQLAARPDPAGQPELAVSLGSAAGPDLAAAPPEVAARSEPAELAVRPEVSAPSQLAARSGPARRAVDLA